MWEFFEQLRWLAEIGGEHIGGVARNPLRQVDALVDSGVEPDQDAHGLVADILDRMAVALAGCSRRRPAAAARAFSNIWC